MLTKGLVVVKHYEGAIKVCKERVRGGTNTLNG